MTQEKNDKARTGSNLEESATSRRRLWLAVVFNQKPSGISEGLTNVQFVFISQGR